MGGESQHGSALPSRLRDGILDPDLLYSFLTQLANKAPGLVAAMMLTRVYPMDQMGAFFFATAYAFFFSLLVNFGTNLHLVRAVASAPELGLARLGEVLALRVPLTIAALVVMNGAIVVLAHDIWRIALLTSLYVLLGDLSHSFGAYVSGLRRFGLRLILALTGPVALVTSVVVAVLLDASLPQVLLCYVGSSVLMLLITALAVRVGFGPIPIPSGLTIVKRVILLCWPLLLLDALQIVQFKIDTVMLYWMVSADAVAEYETAYRLLEVTRLAVRPLAIVAFPLCVTLAAQERWADVSRLLRRTVILAGAVGVLLATVVGIMPEAIMGAVWGETYRASGGILRVLFLTAPPLLISVVCANLANAIHLERTLVVIMGVATVLNLGLNAWAIPIWGPIGAAWTTLATEAAILLSLALVWRRALTARRSDK